MSAAATWKELLQQYDGVAPRRPGPFSSSSTGSTAPRSCSVRRRRAHSRTRDRRTGPFAEATADRAFSRCLGERPAPEAKIEERIARELRFDPDAWIVEVEDRAGRHFLDQIVA